MTVATPHRNQVKGGRNGAAQPKSKFWALTLGSIGVVYGDIGTSPLYALRESVVAAVGPGNPANETVVLGILSLIIWALILIVTVKYIMILLRADNNGEGGTLALMALAHRAVGVRGAAHESYLGCSVRRAVTRDRPDGCLLRASHVRLVRCDRHRRPVACGAELCRFVCLQSDLWRRVSDKPWAHRPDNARRRVPRGHRLGSALCRSRAFRPRPHPHRLAQRRLTGLDDQLSWPGCARFG